MSHAEGEMDVVGGAQEEAFERQSLAPSVASAAASSVFTYASAETSLSSASGSSSSSLNHHPNRLYHGHRHHHRHHHEFERGEYGGEAISENAALIMRSDRKKASPSPVVLVSGSPTNVIRHHQQDSRMMINSSPAPSASTSVGADSMRTTEMEGLEYDARSIGSRSALTMTTTTTTKVNNGGGGIILGGGSLGHFVGPSPSSSANIVLSRHSSIEVIAEEDGRRSASSTTSSSSITSYDPAARNFPRQMGKNDGGGEMLVEREKEEEEEEEDEEDVWGVMSSTSSTRDGPRKRVKPRAPSSTISSASSSESLPSVSPIHGGGNFTFENGSYAHSHHHRVVGLQDFELVTYLGRGSHGTVFLVRHRESTRLLAMKSLRKRSVLKNKQIDNTLRELRVNVRLARDGRSRAPYVVPLRFAFHTQTRLFMVFDYCPGGELYYHIGKRGRLPEVLARFYCSEIALSIGYLHALGVAYRDLKPENLMLDASGHLNLVDFGLCAENVRSPVKGITESFSGTTEYMAPEALKRVECGYAVDWWAFGMVLYEMLVGTPPFYDSKDQNVTVKNILEAPLVFPPHIQVSNAAKDLITKLLIKDPAARLGSTGGARQVMTHPFFGGVDWVQLARRAVEPPFIPPCTSSAYAAVVAPSSSSSSSSSSTTTPHSSPSPAEIPPGLDNFDPECTTKRIVSPPPHDYLPPAPNDPFEGFYFKF